MCRVHPCYRRLHKGPGLVKRPGALMRRDVEPQDSENGSGRWDGPVHGGVLRWRRSSASLRSLQVQTRHLHAISYMGKRWNSEGEPWRSKGNNGAWIRCDHGIPYTKDITSTVEHHLMLRRKGYPALIYSGDHDSGFSFVGTQAWIRSLNLSITDDWRPWYVDGQVAGYTRTYSSNLTYATVKGAGHTTPEYKPKECLAMFTRWISGEPLWKMIFNLIYGVGRVCVIIVPSEIR